MDYQTAKLELSKARSQTAGKPVAPNTRLFARGENIALRLHQTDILTFRPDGAVIYSTGGWKTVTTKARMNEYGPASIFSDRGLWKVCAGREWDKAKIYAEGLTVYPDGRIEGDAPPTIADEEKSLRKAADKYSREYLTALVAHKVPLPSTGDCWCCCMKTADGKQPMGGADHILSHFKERYFVPSLAWNALNEFGASDAAKQALHDLQSGGDSYFSRNDFVRKQIRTYIRRHCLRQLGMAC